MMERRQANFLALGGCLHGRWTFVQADDLRDRKTALKLGEHQAVADAIMRRIAALISPEMRGAYAWSASPCALGAAFYRGRDGRRHNCY